MRPGAAELPQGPSCLPSAVTPGSLRSRPEEPFRAFFIQPAETCHVFGLKGSPAPPSHRSADFDSGFDSSPISRGLPVLLAGAGESPSPLFPRRSLASPPGFGVKARSQRGLVPASGLTCEGGKTRRKRSHFGRTPGRFHRDMPPERPTRTAAPRALGPWKPGWFNPDVRSMRSNTMIVWYFKKTITVGAPRGLRH